MGSGVTSHDLVPSSTVFPEIFIAKEVANSAAPVAASHAVAVAMASGQKPTIAVETAKTKDSLELGHQSELPSTAVLHLGGDAHGMIKAIR
ncbi:hypothetical protein ANCCAN_03239 [Ancylostoma caninum]|uniref:Uncharacterized protein n=1 Tax=Ancylostoma caninum TaxID=29170 RepID=A0A368H1Z4_ANCCA|nr:hypothetical protein ANCCAN_03239 [Ancylostoma caninum]